MRPVYEEMVERWRSMRERRVKGASFTELAAEFGVSRERARQIVAGPEPMPDGLRRSLTATTRRRLRLTRQIERWSKLPGATAQEKVHQLRQELEKEMAG